MARTALAAITEQQPAYERGWPFRTDFPFWMAGHAPFFTRCLRFGRSERRYRT
nr:MAG TPA: hypothetical protein [Caudoviricetes sp.]